MRLHLLIEQNLPQARYVMNQEADAEFAPASTA
jgi:hypothetical protein